MARMAVRVGGLLAGLVPLRVCVVGRAEAALLPACPTVRPAVRPRACECSGQQHAPVARTRALLFISLCEEELKKVGQWGDAPNTGGCTHPTSSFKHGTARTEPQALIAVGCIRRHCLGVHTALPPYWRVALIPACCHRNPPVKSSHLP
jgi:hypothetical protein